jgi:hypothetical protein
MEMAGVLHCQICKGSSTRKKYNADRTNLNHDFIIINFLKNNNVEELHILENVHHGDIIVSGWNIYKSDSTVQLIGAYKSALLLVNIV